MCEFMVDRRSLYTISILFLDIPFDKDILAEAAYFHIGYPDG